MTDTEIKMLFDHLEWPLHTVSHYTCDLITKSRDVI